MKIVLKNSTVYVDKKKQSVYNKNGITRAQGNSFRAVTAEASFLTL